MSLLLIGLLIVVFFFTSILSVVTGSTSLITVPAMLQLGIEPRSALATNMFALTFMSLGATLPYLGKGKLDRERLPVLIMLTLVGSVVGALLVMVVPVQSVPQVISVAMIVVTLFSIAKPNLSRVEANGIPASWMVITGYLATFVLGIYGGFFSGGYVTMLTAVYVGLFRLSFIEAIATTKFINIFSSLVATVVFAFQGIVNYQLAIILASVMFIGGNIGSAIALRLGDRWLRRIFFATVSALALKTLVDSTYPSNHSSSDAASN